MKTVLPIENLSKYWPQSLKGKRVGAVLHPASIWTGWRHSLQALNRASETGLFRLTTLFGPQHGILGHTQDNMIEWEGADDPALGLPVFSLYGKNRKPSPEMLQGLDVLLVDLQDVGTRFYTFIWTLLLCMEACEEEGKVLVVCDRPNPLGNSVEEGSPLEDDHLSFVGLHSGTFVRHGKTIGELARTFREECFPRLDLHILPMENHDPTAFFDETGLPWVLPSPNMPTLDTAVVYPGMCLFEATNVSEGRGTTRPFEFFGAPFIDSSKLCSDLSALEIPGVVWREAHFQPTFHKWSGEICHGAQIHVIDRRVYPAFSSAVEILKILFRDYPKDFSWKEPPYEYEYEKLPIDILLGNGWYRRRVIESS